MKIKCVADNNYCCLSFNKMQIFFQPCWHAFIFQCDYDNGNPVRTQE